MKGCFQNGKQMVLVPDNIFKEHYIGDIYGKFFEESNVYNIYSDEIQKF